MRDIRVGTKTIGAAHPVYIIAEMSANHQGGLDKALAIIHAAKEVGADAVKLQTYRADTMTLNSTKEDFLIASHSPWKKYKTKFSLYEKIAMPWEWHVDLVAEGRKIGIDVFSTPFDRSAVDFLETLQMPAYKIASPEITDIPLIKRVGQTKMPVILSTGVATLEDITLAVQTLREQGCQDIILLKCTTAYPAPPAEVNLQTIPDLARRFHCQSGISDHTLGIGIPVAAVALGARVIEKHFVLEDGDDSVDSFFSLKPLEFKAMVDEVRKVEAALGQVTYELTPSAQKSLGARRSLYVAENIKCGEQLTEDNCKSVRGGFGLHPKYLESILGKKVKQDLEMGDRLTWDVVEAVNKESV